MSVKVYEFIPGTALNRADDVAASGFASLRTGQEIVAGGTLLGDAISLLGREASNLSDTSVGLLYEGQYRRVRLDAGATAANTGTGKAAFVVPGYTVMSASVLTPGSGQTPGTYQLPAASQNGVGTGGVLQVTVNANGTVTANPLLLSSGSGYTLPPTFTLNAGGTPATFNVLMTLNSYIVTTADKATIPFGRGVFLNSVTPGNYTWIQESGIASVLQTTSVGSATLGATATPVQGGNGTFQSTVDTVAPGSLAYGLALDIPAANSLYRVLLTLPGWQG